MKTITINTIPGFDEWRIAARQCLNAGHRPQDVLWQIKTADQSDLFGAPTMPTATERSSNKNNKNIHIPKSAVEMFNAALCHKNPDRFSLCYRVLWRILNENKNLLSIKTDNDVLRLTQMVKAVRRDAYKMTAFLRFREIKHNDEEHFVAWYEPEHYSLELKLDFFKTRFKNMRWSILTPYRAAHWDMQNLKLEDTPDTSLYPAEDEVEQYWLTYYASIFNPARPKKGAMLSSMPKKYWKNMPEAVLIEDLLRTSESKARAMIKEREQCNGIK